MHNVWKVFRFELNSILNKRTVRVTTLILCVVIFFVTTIPTLMAVFFPENEDTSENEMGLSIEELGFYFASESLQESDLKVYLGDDLKVYTDEQSLRDDVIDGVINTGFIIEDELTLTSVIQNKDLYGFSTQAIISIMQKIHRDRAFIAQGIDPSLIDRLSNQIVVANEEVLGKDAQSNFLFTYILMLAVYMLVIMYGSFVSTSVAREKDSRTMEILITSTNPSALIVGKVFANALGGLFQLSLLLLSGTFGYFLNQANYPDFIRDMLFNGLSWDAIATFGLFTAVGYLLYLFLYASLGSLVSKVEDVGSAVTPITLLFMVAYGIAIFGMNAPTNLVVKVGSFVPFTAILAMPIRYFLTAVPILEILISMSLMVITTIFLALLSIKIYRLGSLSYGNKLSLVSAMKLILSKDNSDL